MNQALHRVQDICVVGLVTREMLDVLFVIQLKPSLKWYRQRVLRDFPQVAALLLWILTMSTGTKHFKYLQVPATCDWFHLLPVAGGLGVLTIVTETVGEKTH